MRTNFRYPQLTHTEWRNCRLCHRDGNCAKIHIQKDNGRMSQGIIVCTLCRDKHEGRWVVARSWQSDHAEAYESMGGGWSEWVKDNPPLYELIEQLNREEEEHDRSMRVNAESVPSDRDDGRM
jgi:hypothetical protein